MGTFGSFEISASGMDVERRRLEVAALNLANARTTGGSSGAAFHRQVVVARATAGGSGAAASCGFPGSTALEATGAGAMGVMRSAFPGGDAGASGVHVAAVVDDPSPGRREYAPGHPDADADGFVTLPNVDAVTEMVDVMMATRGFEANSAAFAAARDMATRAIDIGRA